MNIRKVAATLAIFAILASAIGVAGYMIFGDPVPAPQAAAPRTQFTVPPSVPKPHEFAIGVVVTEQNCDPAGLCRYVYSIDPKYIGMHPLPDTPFTVGYSIEGGHQPQPDSFTVADGSAQIKQNVTVEGPPGAQLRAVVTNVTG